MNYNWISACTAEGRERLKERTNKGIIVARMAFAPDEIGQCYWMDGFMLNLCGEVVRTWDEAEHSGYTDDGRSILDCIEFLDPETPNTIHIQATTESHGDAGWIAYSPLLKGTVCQAETESEALQELQKSIDALCSFALENPEPPKPQPDENMALKIIQEWCYKAWCEAVMKYQRSDFVTSFQTWWQCSVDEIAAAWNRRA